MVLETTYKVGFGAGSCGQTESLRDLSSVSDLTDCF